MGNKPVLVVKRSFDTWGEFDGYLDSGDTGQDAINEAIRAMSPKQAKAFLIYKYADC